MSDNIVKVSYKETAKTVDRKPSFGIEIPPVNVEKLNRNKIPESVPGTFYDLFSPNVSKKEEREKILMERNQDDTASRKTRTRIIGNPRNYYTFKGLFKTYFTKFLDEVFAGFDIKREPITETMLNNYFYTNGSELANNVVVKRSGLNFEITLPLYKFKINDFSNQLTDDLSSKGSTDTKDQTIKFVQNFWQRNMKTFPLNIQGNRVEEIIDKIAVSLSIDSSYPKANDFYKKYFRFYKLENLDKLTGDFSALNSQGMKALPAPNYPSSTGIKSLTVVGEKPNSDNADKTDYINRIAGTNLVQTQFLVSAIVLLPFEEAKFYVQSEHPKEFEVLDFIHSWYTRAMSVQGSASYPTYKHSMVAVREKNKAYKEFAQPVTNGDKLALTKNNRLIYLPEVELIDQHRQSMVNATYDADTDSYSFKHNPKNLPRYQLVYVDWVNKRVAYTDSNGKLHSINLSVLYPVKATNYVKHLNTVVQKSFLKYIGSIFDKTQAVNLLRGSADQKTFDTAYSILSKYDKLVAQDAAIASSDYIKSRDFNRATLNLYIEFVELFYADPTRENKKDLPIDYPIKTKDLLYNEIFAPIAQVIANLYTSIFGDANHIMHFINGSNRDVPTSLEDLAFLLPFKYVKNYHKLLDKAVEELAPYKDQNNIDLGEPIKLKNFEGVESYLRHQGKAFKKLQKKPKLAIIGVAAGGGKTLITIGDILNNLSDNTVTKPLVLCPNGLIKDYVNEINFAGRGKINAVPFDTNVFNNYAKTETDEDGNVSWDYTRLKALVDNAPVNTIFILGYDVIAGSTSNKVLNVYGTEVYETFSHLEFFASCNFDGVWCDESHYLKGSDSLRVLVNEILIAPIPFKRLLTGTIVPNTLIDLVRQMMLLDPSILGTERQFRQSFSADGAESGTFIPSDKAINDIYALIKQECTFINVQRKKWAAILPELHEHTVEASLTEGQQKVYASLIMKAVDEMESKLSAEEIEALQDETTSEESDEVVERIFDSSIGNLAAVEAFLANPISVNKELQEKYYTTPEDYISPKGKAVLEIVKEHLASPKQHPGKILVFCNTHAAVAGIWNSLPSDIKAKTIYYSAAKKADYEREFKTNPEKRILIGVSDSLDTGLNLQAADTIIRVDTVWTPGKLEQGNARINRPNLKEIDKDGKRFDFRKENGINVYYIVVDRTIDVIKLAKLTSKTVTLAKFYNSDGADAKYYENLGYDENGKPITPLKVSFKLLRQGLAFEQLGPYLSAYEDLRSIENEIYQEYANKNPEELEPIPIAHDGIIKGSKVLRNVPYVAGAGIFNSDQLGLVPYLQYKQKFISDNGEDEWNPEGLLIHTEFGDGTCIKETASTVHIRMESGIRLPISPSKIFVVTKKLTSTMEIRDQLVKTTGLDSVDIQLDTHRNQQREEKRKIREEKERLAEEKRKARELKRQRKEEEIEKRKNNKTKLNPVTVVQEDESQEDEEEYTSDLEIKIALFNDTIGLEIESEDPESEIGLFKKYGFVITRPYLAAEIKRKDSLETLLDKMNSMQEKGVIDMDQPHWDMWNHIEYEFNQGRSKLLQVTQTPKTKINHFLRTNYRRVRTPTTLRAVPLIIDSKLYMVIDFASHSSVTLNKIRKLVVSGVTWKMHEPMLLAMYPNKSSLARAVKEMEHDGWTITNKKDFAAYYQRTKVKTK